MKYSRILSTGLVLATLALTACKKNNFVVDKDVTQPDAFAKFNLLTTADSIFTYYVANTGNTFSVPIGVTDVQQVDRTVQLEYVSNSAVNGVHYSAPTTITIPAGEAIANLVITGDIPSYNGGRVDTVSVRVVDGGDIPAANYYKSIRLYIRPDCNEANVVLASLEGDYDNSNEDLSGSAYGPYTVTVDDITAATATTAVATISNFYDTGWTGALFDMDWTDPSNRTVITRDQEIIGSDAGDLSSSYAGFTVSIRPHPSMTDGTFSYCTQTWTLTMQLGVTGLGYFNNTYQVDLAR